MTAGTEEGYTGLERTLLARNRELERRIDELEKMYDRIGQELLEALNTASAYRIAAAQSYDGPERRLAIERRKLEASFLVTGLRKNVKDRRKSWPR
jgi:hypothetical protein